MSIASSNNDNARAQHEEGHSLFYHIILLIEIDGLVYRQPRAIRYTPGSQLQRHNIIYNNNVLILSPP